MAGRCCSCMCGNAAGRHCESSCATGLIGKDCLAQRWRAAALSLSRYCCTNAYSKYVAWCTYAVFSVVLLTPLSWIFCAAAVRSIFQKMKKPSVVTIACIYREVINPRQLFNIPPFQRPPKSTSTQKLVMQTSLYIHASHGCAPTGKKNLPSRSQADIPGAARLLHRPAKGSCWAL